MMAVATSLVALSMGLTACAAPKAASGKTILTIGREGNTVFTRNFNPFSPTALPGTTTAIYEPLVVYTPTNEKTTPWLATSWVWGAQAKSLTFHLREGVEWSDGKPFSSADVVETFTILKKDFGGGGYPYIESVTAPDANTVTFTLAKSFSPALDQIGEQVIVPAHIWQNVPDPTKSTNPDPVGTGPFTKVATFQSQVYELDKNTSYWQKGKPAFDGIKYPAYAGNDQVQEALVQGDIDWADIYVPNVDRTYVAQNPAHFSYWFAPTGYTVPLYLNTAKAPFNDPVVRKAMSLAINRKANVESVYGSYVNVSNATGLDPKSTSQWFDPSLIASGDWTVQDVAQANTMLDAAGYKRGPDGTRMTPAGAKMSYTVETGSTSTDFVASAQNVARDVKAIGINLTVVPKDWNTVISDVSLGQYDIAHMFGIAGATPYDFYYSMMSCDAVQPVGKMATANYARYCDRKATATLDRFAAATDVDAQHAIGVELQQAFVADAPMVPLFTAPDWGEFNTTRFTGFPSQANPYATGQSRYPGAVIVLTTVKPAT